MDTVTTTALATFPAAPARLELTDHEIDLIKQTVLAGQQVSDAEFAVFLRAAEHTGLDPLMRQIYGIKRQGRLTIQTGIDGYRLIAARSGEMAGSDAPIYGPGDEHPEWATVTVWRYDRIGVRQAYVGVAYWDEFYPGDGAPGTMWRKMPRKMLGKCAEAEALRKAFPAELAGTYTTDEMAQSGQDDPIRGYRDDLIARARALPEGHREQLRRWRQDASIDPRTADIADLRRFDDELGRHEDAAAAERDDDPVDAELVDDSPSRDAGDGPGRPAASGPENTTRAARYATDKVARARVKSAIVETLEAAQFDRSPIDLAHRAGLA